jgi:hypothetical protein
MQIIGSTSLRAQAYSKACAQTSSPASGAALMSGAAVLVLLGVVKWGSVVGEDGMDLVRDGGNQAAQEVPRGATRHFSCISTKANFDFGRMGDEQVAFALRHTDSKSARSSKCRD